MKFRSLLLVLLIALCPIGALAQSDESSTYQVKSSELTAKSFTFTHSDAPPKISAVHIFELAFNTSPGTETLTITPCMRSGTCGTPVTQTGTSSVVLTIPGVWNYYQVQASWTNAETTVTLNITGSHSLGLSRTGDGTFLSTAASLPLDGCAEWVNGNLYSTGSFSCNQSTSAYAPNTLISGGGVVWVSGYMFSVSPASYIINNTLYNSPLTTVTLAAADPTYGRIDVIGVDNTGSVFTEEGVPSSVPQEPVVDPNSQLVLTFVYIAAGSTTPINSSQNIIYAEDHEWTTSGSTAYNFNSSVNPYQGSVSIAATNTVSGNYALFLAPASLDLSSQNLLVFYIKVNGSWPKQKSIQIQWQNNGLVVGKPVLIKNGSFGLNTSATSYQQIVIPLSSFSVPAGTLINQFDLTVTGGGSTLSFYLDNIMTQGGISSTTNTFNGMIWAGPWNTTKAYSVNDVVSYNNAIYIANTSNVNSIPNISSSWSLILASGSGSANTSDNEIPSGSINGSNTSFITLYTPSTASKVKLYLNGLREVYNSDYTVSGNTITMTNPPVIGDNLIVDYPY